MNESSNWPIVVIVGAAICVLVSFPALFGTLLGIGAVLLFAALLIAGFVFLLNHWDAMPPWFIVVGLLLFCFLFFRPGLGVFIGVGIVGAIFLLVYLALESF